MATPRRQYDAEQIASIVKVDPVVVHYTHGDGVATLHAPQCQHRADSMSQPFSPTTLLADDWFYVAPCAKKAPKAD